MISFSAFGVSLLLCTHAISSLQANDYFWTFNDNTVDIGSKDYISALVNINIPGKDYCQGALLSKNIVLTSAVCFFEKNNKLSNTTGVFVSTLDLSGRSSNVTNAFFQPKIRVDANENHAILFLEQNIYLDDTEYAKLEPVDSDENQILAMKNHEYFTVAHKTGLDHRREKYYNLLKTKSFNVKKYRSEVIPRIGFSYQGTQGAPIFHYNYKQLVLSGIYYKVFEWGVNECITVYYSYISFAIDWILETTKLDRSYLLYNKDTKLNAANNSGYASYDSLNMIGANPVYKQKVTIANFNELNNPFEQNSKIYNVRDQIELNPHRYTPPKMYIGNVCVDDLINLID
ncbi:hypothetical protein AYI70_g7980 [Smittium culicis]|uniref:Peptidase S1 domain-containing protein n=1 Tax=Smittium culicis TaxID=133412 RepID=A0A1R1XI45_9FUNG|nr:hypothetical protein AYI70_g7980 [Smittium culicis]